MPKAFLLAAALMVLTLPAFAQMIDTDDADVLEQPDGVVIVEENEVPEVPVSVEIVEEESDWDKMQEMSNLSLFNEALISTGLYRILESGQPYTIFAPTNSAMRRMPPQEKKRLNDPQHLDLLRKTVAYHIAPGLHPSEDFTIGKNRLSTLEGAKLSLRVGANNIYAENAKISKRDIELDHIIIHKVNEVLTEAQ